MEARALIRAMTGIVAYRKKRATAQKWLLVHPLGKVARLGAK